jgi:AraC-like DNA-binding protein
MLSDFNPPDKRLRNGCEREHYEIMWIWEGAGNYKVNHSNYPITPNSLYCGAPGQYHQLVADDAVKGLIISFNYDFIHHGDDSDGVTCAPVLNEFFQFAIVRLEEGVAGELNMLIEKMQFELKNGQQMKTEILKFYLRILLIHIKRTMNISEEGIAGVNSMVRKFFTQVETDFVKKKSVSEYASMLCITANYLNQIVKQQTGDTAGFYIRRRIIAEAKRKALHSDQSMKQIAFSLGFDSEAHFSKFFKNYTGTNFSEFKRNCFSQASSSLQSYQRHLKQPA